MENTASVSFNTVSSASFCVCVTSNLKKKGYLKINNITIFKCFTYIGFFFLIFQLRLTYNIILVILSILNSCAFALVGTQYLLNE